MTLTRGSAGSKAWFQINPTGPCKVTETGGEDRRVKDTWEREREKEREREGERRKKQQL